MTNVLRPTYALESVEGILEKPEVVSGIRMVAFDVDGTLTEHHGTPDESVSYVLRTLGDRGLSLCVISNAYGERVEELHDILGDPFDMAIFTPANVAQSGERVTKYRKPSPAILNMAMRVHGIGREETLMVGDQIAKDVVSANRAGTRSLLVPRRGDGDDIKVRLLQRPPEALARGIMGIRFNK